MKGKDTNAWRWLVRDRLRFVVFMGTSLAGCLVASCVAIAGDFPGRDVSFIGQMGALSGGISGLLLSGWFGRPGAYGWFLAIGAALLAPGIGGALAGTFVAPGEGSIAGLILPYLTFAHPVPAAAWLICLLALHLPLRTWRTVRDPETIKEEVFD